MLKRDVPGNPGPERLRHAWEGRPSDLPPALFFAHQGDLLLGFGKAAGAR
ncbi:hypothetical protein [Rhodobacteraceae bacterium DSL-40]